MTRFIFLLLVLCFAVSSINAQEFAKQIEGRVFSKDGDVAAVHVSNISTRRGTITDVSGYFEITARLNDTLVFSAVQYERVELMVTWEILEKSLLQVPLKQSLTYLDEVVVMPYNLTGDLNRDMGNMKVGPVVTASTLGLPNAYVKVKTQNERKLFEADNGPWVYLGNYSLDTTFNPMIMVNFNKILNSITGRTKKLKKYVAIDKEIALLRNVKRSFPDSVYVQELKIPKEGLDEFFYFCEADSTFTTVAETGNELVVWEFLQGKSEEYHLNNKLKTQAE